VGGIARRRGGDQLALGQLAGQSLADRDQRVARAGHTHGLIDVAAAGQGVADGAADAGGRAAEGLDLGGVVVGLVLNRNSQSWSSPSTSHLILTVQALISSLSSRFFRIPRCLRALAPMVARSIRQRGFSVRPVSWRRAM